MACNFACAETAYPKRRRVCDRLSEPMVKKDFGWISFVVYLNLFGNKDFEEEEEDILMISITSIAS